MKRDDPNQTGEDCNSVTGSESVDDTPKSESSTPSCLEDCRNTEETLTIPSEEPEPVVQSEKKKTFAKVKQQMKRLKKLPGALVDKFKKKINELPKPQDLPCLSSSAETVSAAEQNSKREQIVVFSRSLLQKFRKAKFKKND